MMNRLIVMLSLAAVLLCTRAGAAPDYAARMAEWEKESGQKSRMTVYARAGALPLTSIDPETTRKIKLALDAPFEKDLGFIKPFATSYEPAARLFIEALTIEGNGHFAYANYDDPVPNMAAMQNIGRYMALRSQAYALAGNTDAALADATALWLAGHSFETTTGGLLGNVTGMTLRSLALDQLIALVEKYNLTFDQQSRVVTALTKEIPDKSSQIDIVLHDFKASPAMMQGHVEASAAKIEEAMQMMLTATEPFRDADYAKQKTLLPAYEEARKKAVAILGENSVVDIEVLINRKAVVDAKQAVLLTAICVGSANSHAEGGKATEEQIFAMAKTFPELVTDPFTGKAPRVRNAGGNKFLVISPGPDGEFSPDAELTRYSSRFGLMSKGDIVLKKE